MILLKELTLLCIVSVICSLLCVYVYMKNKAAYPDMSHAIPVLAIVETIQKLCPLGPLNQWHLLSVGSGSPRCWHRNFPMKILDRNIGIYGSSVLVKAPALYIMKMISNTDYWTYWIPLVPKHLQIEQFENPLLREDGFMQSVKIINKCSNKCSYMFSHLSNDNLGWILFWNTKTVYLSFFLIQPLIQDENQCLLTYILGCYLKSCQKTIAERLIFNINSIKDATENSSPYVLPFFLNYSMESKDKPLLDFLNSTTNDYNSNSLQKTKLKGKFSIKNSSRSLLLLPYMQGSLSFIKRLQNFELINSPTENQDPSNIKQLWMQKKKLRSHACNKPNLAAIKHGLHTSFKNIAPRPEISIPKSGNASFENTDIEFNIRQSKTISATEKANSDIPNITYANKDQCASDLGLLSKKTPFSINENFEIQDLDGYDGNLPLEVEHSHPFYENNEGDLTLKANGEYSHYTSEFDKFEILLPDSPISSRRLADIKTRGNYCASELQVEILEASSVHLLRGIGNPNSIGQWFLRGNIKGIAVFSKFHIFGSLKIISFLCRINIPVKPEEVWNFIKNPYCRFMCDESVKRVRVLEEISNDQKIVYIYHEIGILKKEVIDFCLLHTERQEHSKYYLAFYSTEFENCPLMDSVTRGTLLPSGFVIAADSSENRSTEVKYLYQTVVDNPDSTFLQILDHSVASFLNNLENYMLTKPI